MPSLHRISTRPIAAACVLLIYAAFALRQPQAATVMFVVATALAGILLIVPDRTIPVRVVVTAIAYVLFVVGRLDTRRIVLASAVLVWVLASAYFTTRAGKRLGVAALIFGAISDQWLVTILTLLSLEGYIATGLLVISVASWIPRAGKTKLWLALAYALLGGWLIIAAKLDFDLELRRWYLLGALAIGITASLFSSAQEVQQREDVDPQ